MFVSGENMKIELNCLMCGGNRFIYPAKLTDDSLIICDDCGHEVGTLADLQQKVIQELASRSSSR